MKKLVSPGVTLIVARPNRFGVGKRDPFPLHSVGFLNLNFETGASGKVWCFAPFYLKDYQLYLYMIDWRLDTTAANLWQLEYENYTTSDDVRGCLGEWYNDIARPMTLDKVLAVDIAAWMAAH